MGRRSRLDWPMTICVVASSAIVGFGVWFASSAHDHISHIEDATLADCVDTVTETHLRSGVDVCGFDSSLLWPTDSESADLLLIKTAMTPPER